MKDVLDLLISICLVQSTAYPPEQDLDAYLAKLINTPEKALAEFAAIDYEATEILHKVLSGYATLRRFYLVRDHDSTASNTRGHAGLRNKQMTEAASALLAVIVSSHDNIVGGLHDETRGAVVGVDFLLALLGEALAFVNQEDFLLCSDQIHTLLRAVEDLQSVHSRIYTACDDFVATVMASAPGLKGSTPSDMLQKSMSQSNGSFSLVGSSVLASQLKRSMHSSRQLGKNGCINRAWDWRRGLTAATSGHDILRLLRIGLARDLAKSWLSEIDNLA